MLNPAVVTELVPMLYERAARKLGAEAGKAAASWYFDGNSSDDAYLVTLQGIEDGDPAIYHDFPSSPLSGEYADDPTPSSLLDDLGIAYEDAYEGFDYILVAYEDGFHEAAHDEIERVARYMLAPDVDAMTIAYVECALWAGLDWSREHYGNPPPLDDNYDAGDVAPSAVAEIRAECEAFAYANAIDLHGLDAGQCGHDFYLTRNHHGVGFWDRGYGEIGDRLTEAANAYGPANLVVCSGGILYHEEG